MTFLRRPSVRRFLAVVLVGYMLSGPVIGAVETGWPGLLGVIPIGAATVGCCLWVLLGRKPRRDALLLAATLAGGLALHGISPYSGMGFMYIVIFTAPFKTRLWPAAFLVTADVAATTAVSFLLGLPVAEVLGNTFGLTYVAVFTFLMRHVKATRDHAAALAEARAGEAVLAERARLAREVHDILAHSQSAQIVHLEGARLLLERGLERGEDTTAALDRVNRAVRLARAGLEETRRALDALRGEELPLAERLERLAVEFRSVTGSSCAVSVAGNLDGLEAGARLAVARTAQEALTNVRKHAPGAAASVALRRVGRWCELEIRDTGGPPGPTAPSGGGYGLVGMRERAELIGGSLAVRSGEEGFEVLLRVPYGTTTPGA
ncbi:histidine kinase [Streptosporangium sp. NPDC006930]|uniref:sensor histidine kinase n=1 Tax=unclassified Streptosporangium TaxID=2632669 RepID=UPI0034287D02